MNFGYKNLYNQSTDPASAGRKSSFPLFHCERSELGGGKSDCGPERLQEEKLDRDG